MLEFIDNDKLLEMAASHLKAGELDAAVRQCNKVLNVDPDNVSALFMVSHAMIKAERWGLAYVLLRRATELMPRKGALWNNLGRCLQELKRPEESISAFKTAIRLDDKDAHAWNNLGLTYVNQCLPEKAVNALNRAIELSPDLAPAKENKGLADLMLRKWGEGWDGYEYSEGNNHRRMRIYGDAPQWDGTKTGTVVFYGEQGIGDEISFASCLPDAMKHCDHAIIDCDARLVRLFERSFPGAEVYGTRMHSDPSWVAEKDIDASAIIGSLPKLYRRKTEDFPGTPYLIADPVKRKAWREKLDALGPKPKIGIAWRGGSFSTNSEARSLKSIYEITSAIDADFISLEYRKHDEICVHSFDLDHDDYDDTAALVAELDLVISVTTAVVHLAGGLGVPVYCLVPSKPRWFYGMYGDSLPWYNSVKLFRQKKGVWPIGEVVNEANQNIHRLRSERERSVSCALQLDPEASECSSEHDPAGPDRIAACA